MSAPEYKPIGTFAAQSRTRAVHAADWKPYTDDPDSPFGPNGLFAHEGAGTQVAFTFDLTLEGDRRA